MSPKKPHPYLLPLQKAYEANRDNHRAADMSRYMKNLFPFVGIPSPARKEIFKLHLTQYGIPEYRDLVTVTKSCYAQTEREYHYFAIELAGKFAKKADESFVPVMEFLIVNNSWWDSVDSTASNCTREFFKRNVSLQRSVTRKWMNSGNIWLQRSALLFQVNYKKVTNEKLLYSYIEELKHSNEFFIQKAIGWALREYAKTNKKSVANFIKSTTLKPLSVREAQKHFGD
ncbi:MAG: DNA alkylation repair protein [Bacteroidetes bacterium]|nr:DNA alkylation repair protein [Bacteroidota bacterium]MBK8659265.1 DNA alkylation repair protein [Bacteroidota bacterium]